MSRVILRSFAGGFAASVLMGAALCLAGARAAPLAAQEAPADHDLHDYDWTAWLEGVWEGSLEQEGGVLLAYRQDFKIVAGGHAVLTTNRIGEGGGGYEGAGLFRYFPAEGRASGHWTGSLPDTAFGVALRDGDRMSWTIHRLGTTVERVRERVGDDAMVTTNTTTHPDGTRSVSVERLQRAAPRAGRGASGRGASTRSTPASLVEVPRELEIELARSALPEHLRTAATVLVLEQGVGYVPAVEGTNGFRTMVSRVEPAVFKSDRAYERHVPDVLLPISFDRAGVDGPMQPFLDAGELLAKGTEPVEMRRIMRERFESDRYRPAERTGVSYMLAPVMRAYPTPVRDDRVVTVNAPHRMFYAPYLTSEDIGGTGAGREQAYVIQEGMHGYIGQRAGPVEVEAINTEHAELVRALCALHEPWCLPGGGPSTEPGVQVAPRAEALSREARDVALRMPWAIDYGDREAFEALFAEDAVMYFPFRAARAEGLREIAAVMRPIFERNSERGAGPYFGFEPSDVVVELFGESGAVVSWIMVRDAGVSRRTAALRRIDGAWKIAVVHADNWAS